MLPATTGGITLVASRLVPDISQASTTVITARQRHAIAPQTSARDRADLQHVARWFTQAAVKLRVLAACSRAGQASCALGAYDGHDAAGPGQVIAIE